MMIIDKKLKHSGGGHGLTWMIRAYTMTRIRAIGFYFLVATRAQTPMIFHPNAKGRIVQ